MAPGTAALRPSRHRHHAESAALVTAFNDREISAEAIVATGELGLEAILRVETQPLYPAVSGLDLRQQIRQLRIAGRTAHQADLRRPLEKAIAFLLRHATQHANDFLLARRRLAERPQAREYLLRRLLPNAAGVVENNVGVLVAVHGAVAPLHQYASYLLGVMNIHLAAESLDVKSLAGTCARGGDREFRWSRNRPSGKSLRLTSSNLN